MVPTVKKRKIRSQSGTKKRPDCKVPAEKGFFKVSPRETDHLEVVSDARDKLENDSMLCFPKEACSGETSSYAD